MKIKIANRDHEWVAVSIQFGGATKNLTLQRQDDGEVDTGANTARFAYKLSNNAIGPTEFDKYSVPVEMPSLVFGKPKGLIPEPALRKVSP